MNANRILNVALFTVVVSLAVPFLALAGGCGSASACDSGTMKTSQASAGATGAQVPAGEAKMNIMEVAVSAGTFKTLVAAVQAADLVSVLSGEGPFTVFAPTDEAFAKLPQGTVEALLKDKAKLAAILTYHVVPGRLMAADVLKSTELKTVQGQKARINTQDGVRINDARVVQTDIVATNGVIHVIDTVILPPAAM